MRRAFFWLYSCGLAAGLAPRKAGRRVAPLQAAGAAAEAPERYSEWTVDVAAFEKTRKTEPLVYVDVSPGAGRGVFAARDVAAGATLTEFVGLLAATPATRCEEMELQQSFYGSNWRTFSQRYEIGLSASKVTDSGGRADGGRVEEGNGFGDEADTCDAEEGLEACVARHGAGEYVLLGKVPEQGASPHEGVAQLINDHTALRAPTLSDDGDGIISTRDVDQLIVASSKVPIKTNVRLLRKAVDDYIDRIATRTNVALVQPRTAAQGVSAPRVFAVATRPIARGEELRMTYGVEWWLSQLRTAALAQLVTCEPGPMRKAALAGVIRDFERVSLEAVAKQRAAVSLAGCMPGSYVQPLEAVPALDSLLDDGWRRAILYEEFATATECPLDHVYIDTSPPKAPWPPISESNRPDF